MDINIIESENCKRELVAKLTYEELTPHFEKALNDYRKKVQLPGFRKGKAPLSMIKKMYNDAIEYSALEDIANEIFRNYLIENKIPIVGTGTITDLDYKPKETLTVKVEFEIIPEVVLSTVKGIELTKTKYVIDESLVDEELQYVRFKNATFEIDGQALDNEYMVTIDTVELDEAGNPIEGKEEKNLRFYLNSDYLSKEYKKALQKIKEGEEREVDSKDKDGNPVKLRVKCTKVEKVIYPEMNEETFKKFSGKDDIKTEEELRNFLREEIAKAYNEHGEQDIRNKAVAEVVKLNEVKVPDKYVDSILDDYFKGYKEEHKGHNHEINEEEFRNSSRGDALFTGKWFLIKEKLIDQEKIEVNDDDIMKFAEKNAKMYNLPADKLFEFYKQNDDVKNSVLNNKVVDFIIENATITEVEEVKKSVTEQAKEKKKESKKETKKEK
ncbi:MAG: trigger factor [Ignavibacteria bacterium]|nr:trigger factor [Ignavibacteria bacterium]